MNDERRLTSCFQTVFPDLPEMSIPSASQALIPAWDSIAAITLVNVIEEEFQLQMDFDLLGELDSFQRILKYLEQQKVS
jgi:acyl carrier protein